MAESTVLYHLRRNGIARRDRAEHVRKVTSEMVDGWVERYDSGESLKQIAGGEVSPVTVWNHLRKRSVELRDKFEALVKAIGKHEKSPFLGSAVDRAYVLGLRYGDLHVVRHGRAVRVRVTTTHPAMAELFESLFSPYGFAQWYPRRAALVGYEWTLECDLDSTFDFLMERLNIEDLIALPTEEFLGFLAGVIDAEGTIYLHRKISSAFELSISNTDLALLSTLKRRLLMLGYHPLLYHRRQGIMRLGYMKEGEIEVLRLYRYGEVCRLLGRLCLKHREKRIKSSFVTEGICRSKFGLSMDPLEDWENLTGQILKDGNEFVAFAASVIEFLDSGTRFGTIAKTVV